MGETKGRGRKRRAAGGGSLLRPPWGEAPQAYSRPSSTIHPRPKEAEGEIASRAARLGGGGRVPPPGGLASPSVGSNRLRSPRTPAPVTGDDPGSSIVLLHTSEALLLDVRDLAARDRIVTFLTRERGKKSGVARGPRARHSRFAGQLQPLGKAQITWFEKPGRDLVRISAVELVRPVHRLQADLEGILLGSYLADHMLEFAQEDESSELLFRLLDSTLEALLAGVDQDVAARYFECWVLRLGGIFPAPDACPRCATPLAARAVLPPHGETLLCPACARGAVAAGLEDVPLSDGGERPPRPPPGG